jgi:transcriptional regulator with XRE-family HTH domain
VPPATASQLDPRPERHQSDDAVLAAAGRGIRRARKAAGLTQQQLADRAGLHRSYLAGLEGGRRNASLLTLAAIARALRLELAELLRA